MKIASGKINLTVVLAACSSAISNRFVRKDIGKRAKRLSDRRT